MYDSAANGTVTSTARLVFDNTVVGLPSDEHNAKVLNELRVSGKKLAELSKLVSSQATKSGVVKHYLRKTYELSTACGISSVIITCLARNASFYSKTTGSKTLVPDIGYRFGIDKSFSLLEWDIKNSKQPLQKWLKEDLV
jgi:hypothetical protein